MVRAPAWILAFLSDFEPRSSGKSWIEWLAGDVGFLGISYWPNKWLDTGIIIFNLDAVAAL